MAKFDFMTPSEVRALGLGSVGRRVLIRKTARFINPLAIHIGDNVMIDDFVLLHASEDIVLQGNNQIGAFSALFGRFGLYMGRYATVASHVAIYSESDDYSGASMVNPTVPDDFKPEFSSKAVRLEQHTIVGAHSVLLPGAHLDTGVAVGAQSLVKGHLPEWGIYGGQPARLLKERSRALLALAKQYEGKT